MKSPSEKALFERGHRGLNFMRVRRSPKMCESIPVAEPMKEAMKRFWSPERL